MVILTRLIPFTRLNNLVMIIVIIMIDRDGDKDDDEDDGGDDETYLSKSFKHDEAQTLPMCLDNWVLPYL